MLMLFFEVLSSMLFFWILLVLDKVEYESYVFELPRSEHQQKINIISCKLSAWCPPSSFPHIK